MRRTRSAGLQRCVAVAFVIPEYDALLAISARGVWDPSAFDLAADRERWSTIPGAVRERLLGLFAAFLVGEEAVAEHLVPFEDAAVDPEFRDCLRAQQVEEERHAVATGLVWTAFADPSDHGVDGAKRHAPAALVALFAEELPRTAAAAGSDLTSAVALYHGLLEGVVFLAGQTAVRGLAERWELAAVAGMFGRIERDERWHVTLGVRALVDAPDGAAIAADLPRRARAAADSWGPLVDDATKDDAVALVSRRLTAAGLLAGAASPAG